MVWQGSFERERDIKNYKVNGTKFEKTLGI